MTEITPIPPISEEVLAEKRELFRYTDLSHPLIDLLFNLQLNQPTQAE
jgi:hypothetical protein